MKNYWLNKSFLKECEDFHKELKLPAAWDFYNELDKTIKEKYGSQYAIVKGEQNDIRRGN